VASRALPSCISGSCGAVDAGDDVLRAERHLRGLGEEVAHQPCPLVPVGAARRTGSLFLGTILSGQDVRPDGSASRRRTLPPEPPTRGRLRGDGVPQVSPEVGVAPLLFNSALRSPTCLQAQLRFQWNFTTCTGPRRSLPGVTPKPPNRRSWDARSDMIHIIMCADSGSTNESQKFVLARSEACRKPRRAPAWPGG